MRFCSKCLQCKDESCFNKSSINYTGLRPDCKDCRGSKGIYIRPIKNVSINQKRYHEKNREIINEKYRSRRLINLESSQKKASEYRNSNRQRVRDAANSWYHANKNKVFEKLKVKRHTNPFFKMKGVLKTRIHMAFKYKSWKKDSKTRQMLGADYEVVKKHIERQFKKGMSWDNYGRHTWHIDHKIPLSSAKTVEEMKILCHYTNLQPLWAQENILKSDKILPTQMVLTI